MTGEHRFLRTRNGITVFARVRLTSRLGEHWTTIVSPELGRLRDIYEPALRAGIDLAADAHMQRGVQPQVVEVVDLGHSFVDTTLDAVKCAAALAAWKAWGHLESEATIVFADGEWSIMFQPRSP